MSRTIRAAVAFVLLAAATTVAQPWRSSTFERDLHNMVARSGKISDSDFIVRTLGMKPVALADLGTPNDGVLAFCFDCQATNPCSSGGSGAIAERVGGNWVCTGAGGGGGDNVSIDGVGATDPDFRSEGSIDTIRCTGAGVPDAACVGAEDVIFRLNAGAVDAITEIDTPLKSGVDPTIITGTKGTSGNCAQWNVDGDLIDSGGVCGVGDVTDVWSATSGNVNALTAAAGDSLDAGSADSSKPCKRGDTLPGTCTEGECFHDTDSNLGVEVYWCTATDSWVLAGDVTASSTDTFQNKTINAEASGNVITLPSKLLILAAACDNATAASGFDLPSTGAPTPTCVEGTNTRKAYLDFADSGTQSAYYHIALPGDWTGDVDVEVKWLTTATTGNVVWQVATACVADGETDDPAFNAANTITDAAKGTTNQMNDASAQAITMTGCAAGELWHIKFFRDPAHASDTIAATARLSTVMFTVRRAM